MRRLTGIENVRATKRAADLPLSSSLASYFFNGFTLFLQRGLLISARLSLRVSGVLL